MPHLWGSQSSDGRKVEIQLLQGGDKQRLQSHQATLSCSQEVNMEVTEILRCPVCLAIQDPPTGKWEDGREAADIFTSQEYVDAVVRYKHCPRHSRGYNPSRGWE